jgi:hypothetical protein
VRNCSSFGLPNYIRLAVPALRDVDRVLHSAGQVIAAGVEA